MALSIFSITDFTLYASRLVFGAFATFCAILLWSRSRDMAWTLVIIGAIVSYVDIVFATLVAVGILDRSLLVYNGIPLGRIVLDSAPPLLTGVGFLVAALRRRIG